eukprot:TRINITY_DN10453_c0_g2_i1.p1 TRINITY_DN10453_c0_g2~~TRINITY_DN10453_c0_g2_i1.p1  ORF type:complete len:145 (-),score=31.69 TRINITY_DN10453_c0_g2_i1:56-490(-)
MRNKVPVSWSIQQSNLMFLRREVIHRHVHRNASLSLLLILIQDPCKLKRRFANVFALSLVLLYRLLCHVSQEEEEVAHDGRLARVDVSHHDQIQMACLSLFLLLLLDLLFYFFPLGIRTLFHHLLHCNWGFQLLLFLCIFSPIF